MVDLEKTLFSATPDWEQTISNPKIIVNSSIVVTRNSKLRVSKLSDQEAPVYHAPFSVSFLRLQGKHMGYQRWADSRQNNRGGW